MTTMTIEVPAQDEIEGFTCEAEISRGYGSTRIDPGQADAVESLTNFRTLAGEAFEPTDAHRAAAMEIAETELQSGAAHEEPEYENDFDD